jgi:CRP-like cAMP-binding protein
VFREEYDQARDFYIQALALPENEGNLDLRLRYAWCAQKCGDTEEAMRVYQQVMQQYRDMGEASAADALTTVMEQLQSAKEAVPASDNPPADDESWQPLSEQELTDALWGMGRIRQMQREEVLCQVGDPPDALWLLQYGSLRVILPDYDEHDYLHAKEKAMIMVGEIGVFTRQRRLATLIADNDIGVVEIPSSDIYNRCMHDKAFAEGLENLILDRWVMPVLSQHAIFNRINDIDRRRLVDVFELESYEPGHVLMDVGDEHDGAYMLQTGCLFYMHSGDDSRNGAFETDTGELVTSVLPGEIVNLAGLLHDFVCPYRIVCATPVQVLHLRREVFEPFALRRPWIIPAILQFSRKPAHLQVMRPADDYLWSADRKLAFADTKRGEV